MIHLTKLSKNLNPLKTNHMNERFKFRIWDVEAKRMQFPTSIPNNIGGSYDNDPIYNTYEDGVNTFYETCPPNPEVINGVQRKGIEDYIIMQWTGLKDKNGKEIYEGDVLKDSYSTFKVFFSYGSFRFEKLQIDDFAEPSLKRLEIIGNIYEHPELLNKQSE